MPKAVKRLYVELPDTGQDNGNHWLANSTIGCRDVSRNWMHDGQKRLERTRRQDGKANPKLFFNQKMNFQDALWGDNFLLL